MREIVVQAHIQGPTGLCKANVIVIASRKACGLWKVWIGKICLETLGQGTEAVVGPFLFASTF